jgi:hypothetical protein
MHIRYTVESCGRWMACAVGSPAGSRGLAGLDSLSLSAACKQGTGISRFASRERRHADSQTWLLSSCYASGANNNPSLGLHHLRSRSIPMPKAQAKGFTLPSPKNRGQALHNIRSISTMRKQLAYSGKSVFPSSLFRKT